MLGYNSSPIVIGAGNCPICLGRLLQSSVCVWVGGVWVCVCLWVIALKSGPAQHRFDFPAEITSCTCWVEHTCTHIVFNCNGAFWEPHNTSCPFLHHSSNEGGNQMSACVKRSTHLCCLRLLSLVARLFLYSFPAFWSFSTTMCIIKTLCCLRNGGFY